MASQPKLKTENIVTMLNLKFAKLGQFTLTLFLFSSCGTKLHDRKEIELSMQKYDQLIQKMNEDSIAMLYAKDGDLGQMAHGRDSIRNFLATFKNYKVLSQSSTTDSITIVGNSSIQIGKYRQVVITPDNDTVTVKGEYKANWIWATEQGWLIKKMETKPLK